jgi:hypothetical protein
MDRKVEIETEKEVLKRIIGLLLSFAGLAERASGRSYPVRCLVLWILRRAEVVAQDWIADGSDDMQSTATCAVLHRNSRAEALHLAQSFRALAHMLRREIRLEEQFGSRLKNGQAFRAEEGEPQHYLLVLSSMLPFARETRVAICRLCNPDFAAMPRLDTS